jgi:hypothetical protein
MCDTKDIVATKGLEMKDLFLSSLNQPSSKPEIQCTYDYTDESEEVLYQVVRMVPKDFWQRRPDGKGGWIKGLYKQDPKYPDDPTKKILAVRLVLFRLPRVIEATKKGKFIFLVEGEKDVLNAEEKLGVYATCNPMGAGKWRKEYNEMLKGARVIVIPDNDKPKPPSGKRPGIEHANHVCESLQGYASKVYLMNLPGVEGVDKDLSNWIEKGGTREQLLEMISGLEEWEPLKIQESRGVITPIGNGERPEIDTSFSRIRDLSACAMNALVQSNNPPYIFVRAGLLSRIIINEKKESTVEIINEKILRGMLDRCANWIKQSKNGNSLPDKPPIDVVNDLLSLRNWNLPPLNDITGTPIISKTGEIVASPGYESSTRLYYSPEKEFILPSVPETPTKENIAEAVGVLNDVICDFPFDDPASHTNAIATIITPIIRPLIDGITPMALFDKPQPGTGASKLADVVSIIATGRTFMMSPLKDDDEWRKTITTLLLNSTPVITFDNLEQKLRSPSLAKLLTSDIWRDRILGKSEPVALDNRTVWMATGNNMRLNSDIARRCYKIRLDAKMSRPWQRTGFKHPKLLPWVHSERPRIIAAVLTIARAWIQAGKPIYDIPTLDYEAWEQTVGSILEFSGIKDFLGNLNSVYEDNDEDSSQWETFIETWHEQLKEDFYTAAELDRLIKNNQTLSDTLPSEISDGRDEKGFTRKIGNALSKKNGVRFSNNLLIEKGKTKQRALTYRVSFNKQQSEFSEFTSQVENENNSTIEPKQDDNIPDMDV